MSEQPRPRRALDARVRTLRGSIYVARGDAMYELEGVAGRIWQLVDGSRSEDEIGRTVAEEFDVDEATAIADTRTFVAELRDAGFLEPAG